MKTTPRLSPMMFALVCEDLESRVSAAFMAAQRAATEGNLDEVERLEALAEAACAKLEALIEGQLQARGEKRPNAPSLAA